MSQDDPFNMELRMKVLEITLALEAGVKELLLNVFNTSNEDRKAISKKSTALSFNNMINILYDVEMINGEEYKKLTLLSQFRNKFMHDVECDSFTQAVLFFNKYSNQKLGKKLLEFNSEKKQDDEEALENSYFLSYKKLSQYLFKMILEKKESYVDLERKKFTLPYELLLYANKVNELISKWAKDDKLFKNDVLNLKLNEDFNLIKSKLDDGVLQELIPKYPAKSS